MNLAAWLLETGEDAAVALLGRGQTLTYRELRARVAGSAAAWRELGVTAGTIVPIVGDNSADLVVAYLGALWLGAIPALVPSVTTAALGAVARETHAPFLAAPTTDDPRASALGLRVVPHALRSAESVAATPGDREALALLLYTSGSTGSPKGVMLCARNVEASTRAIGRFLSLGAADRAYLPMPLHYCYGLSVLHTHLRAGGSVFLGGADAPERVLDELEASAATGVASVPTFFQLLVRRSTLGERALPALRYAMVSGGRLDESHVRALRSARPTLSLFVRYGVTELTAAASYVPPDLLASKLGSIGRGLPELPLRVLDEHGGDLAPGSNRSGEVVVEGNHVALGYFDDAEASARVFEGRRFRTGDLARVDADGFVFLLGRSSEFIKTGGHRVAPREIEDVLHGLLGVAEVCVYGIPSPTRGETIVAAIVAAPGEPPTPIALREACALALPAFKVPSEFRFVSALPRTENGKIDRRALRGKDAGS